MTEEQQEQTEAQRTGTASAKEVASGQAPQSEESPTGQQEPPGAAPVETGASAVQERGYGPVAADEQKARLQAAQAQAANYGAEEFAAGVGRALEALSATGEGADLSSVGQARSELIVEAESLKSQGKVAEANGVEEGVVSLGRVQDGLAEDERVAELRGGEGQEEA